MASLIGSVAVTRSFSLFSVADPVRARALGEVDRLHIADRDDVDLVVGAPSHRLPRAHVASSIFSARTGHGIIGDLVGTLSPRHARCAFCARSDRTTFSREPRRLVLFGQTD